MVRSTILAWVIVCGALGCGDSDTTGRGGSGTGGVEEAGAPGVGGQGGEPPTNQAPSAVITASPASGSAPLMANLSGSESTDPDGQITEYAWNIDGVTDEGADLSRTFEVGCHEVELTVTDDDGATGTATLTIPVASGAPQVPPNVTLDEAPLASAVLPRDLERDEGTAHFSGTVASDGFTHVRADVMEGETVRATVSVPLCGAAPVPFEIDAPIPSQLTAFEVRLSLVSGAESQLFQTVSDLVAGDIYVVQGQSNAVSAQYAGNANENQGPFIRTYGANTEDPTLTANDVLWRTADGNLGGGAGAIGQWPLRMAAQLSARFETPIGLINGARGGVPIGYFQRNDTDPTDLLTNYGRLLVRLRASRLDSSIRAFLFYQGESDGANFQAHHDGFIALKDDWTADFPGFERIYVTQVRAGCGGDLIRTQDVQRLFADEFPEITVMSTTGLNGHDGCHYSYDNGYRELGDRYAGLLARDLYGEVPEADVQPPNPESARYAAGGTQIIVTMRNPDSALTADEGVAASFRFEGGAPATISSVTVEPGRLILGVAGDPSAATGLSYLGAIQTAPWILNENGIGLLTFYGLPIEPE